MELVEGQLVRATDPILFAQSASVNASLCNLHSSKFIAGESCELKDVFAPSIAMFATQRN
jgi:hypothetical protein